MTQTFEIGDRVIIKRNGSAMPRYWGMIGTIISKPEYFSELDHDNGLGHRIELDQMTPDEVQKDALFFWGVASAFRKLPPKETTIDWESCVFKPASFRKSAILEVKVSAPCQNKIEDVRFKSGYRPVVRKRFGKSLAQLAKENNMREGTLQHRLAKGWSLEKALQEPLRSEKNAALKYTCRAHGITVKQYRDRIHNGWSSSDALHRPIGGRPRPEYETPVVVAEKITKPRNNDIKKFLSMPCPKLR